MREPPTGEHLDIPTEVPQHCGSGRDLAAGSGIGAAGYETAFLGEWHMGEFSHEPQPGFDHWVSFRGQGVYYNPVLNVNGHRVERRGASHKASSPECTPFAIGGAATDPRFIQLRLKLDF